MSGPKEFCHWSWQNFEGLRLHHLPEQSEKMWQMTAESPNLLKLFQNESGSIEVLTTIKRQWKWAFIGYFEWGEKSFIGNHWNSESQYQTHILSQFYAMTNLKKSKLRLENCSSLTRSSEILDLLKASVMRSVSRSIFTIVWTFSVSRMWMTWSIAHNGETSFFKAKNIVLGPRLRSFEENSCEGKLSRERKQKLDSRDLSYFQIQIRTLVSKN